MNGIVFDIKEFAIFDGPGVRQTVFFKGCLLRCKWCHNPEGLTLDPQLMVSIPSCTSCGKCFSICPQKRAWDNTFMRSRECDLCQKCIGVCPNGVRRICGKEYTPEALAALLKEKEAYYASYGGGVTFSGGEPLMQSEFLCEMLPLLGTMHKAIETSGYALCETFEKVIRQMDYVLMDLKCMSEEMHKVYTGVSNQQILQNYKRLRELGIPHTIRIPVIPHVNDSRENFERTAALLSGDETLHRVELLPYHKTAGAKYHSVGREYQALPGVEDPVCIGADIIHIFEQYHIHVEVL